MPIPIIAAAAAKIGLAVKGMTVAKASGAVAKGNFFSKIGNGIKNMFSKGRTNVDQYGNPFGKLGQAIGNMFRKDSTPNYDYGVTPTNSISNYLPLGIVGFILYLILKK